MKFDKIYQQLILEERTGKLITNVYYLNRKSRSLIDTIISVDDIMEFMESRGKEGDEVTWSDEKDSWINKNGEIIAAEYVEEVENQQEK